VGRKEDARVLKRRRGIFAALRDADARVYVARNAGYEVGMVGLWARANGRRFVYSSSSAADFDFSPLTAARAGTQLDQWFTRVQYRAGLRVANAVVVQTDEQLALARRVGIRPTLIRSFCPLPPVPHREREAFLWVGALIEFKDPLAYVRLAAAVPEARFWMIATDRGPRWRALADRVRAEAQSVPNLELLAPRPREELLELYERAVAVVTTSYFEGFPNALLEAWARGTPALSLRIDPDGVIAANRLGRVAGASVERLAADAREAWRGRATVDSEQTRTYIARVHDPAAIGGQWAELVRRLAKR
jgi:glycosyltransferase involved in cell wall biosynthesis